MRLIAYMEYLLWCQTRRMLAAKFEIFLRFADLDMQQPGYWIVSGEQE